MILIGHKGVGKSTFAKKESVHSGSEVIHLDDVVSLLSNGMLPDDIIDEFGESLFRLYEYLALRWALDRHRLHYENPNRWNELIVDCGAGIVEHPQSCRLLSEWHSDVYWVKRWVHGEEYTPRATHWKEAGRRDNLYRWLSDKEIKLRHVYDSVDDYLIRCENWFCDRPATVLLDEWVDKSWYCDVHGAK